MGIIKSFDIRRLTPFRKRDEGMPESAATGENLADLDLVWIPQAAGLNDAGGGDAVHLGDELDRVARLHAIGAPGSAGLRLLGARNAAA